MSSLGRTEQQSDANHGAGGVQDLHRSLGPRIPRFQTIEQTASHNLVAYQATLEGFLQPRQTWPFTVATPARCSRRGRRGMQLLFGAFTSTEYELSGVWGFGRSLDKRVQQGPLHGNTSMNSPTLPFSFASRCTSRSLPVSTHALLLDSKSRPVFNVHVRNNRIGVRTETSRLR